MVALAITALVVFLAVAIFYIVGSFAMMQA